MKKSMLFSTIAMIVVVVVSLATATYAWFSATSLPAVSGSLEIAATSDFTLREVSDSGWQIIYTEKSITGEAVFQPMAPSTVIDGYFTHGTNLDAAPTNTAYTATANKNWFGAMTPKANTYDSLAYKNDAEAAIVTHFQLIGNAETLKNAYLTVKMSLAGASTENKTALEAAKVVFLISKNGNDTIVPYGRVYNHGAKVGGDTTLIDAARADINDTSGATLIPNGHVAASANMLDGAAAFSASTWNLDWTHTLSMVRGDTYTITCVVWLDGFAMSQAHQGKTIDIDVSIKSSV